MSNVSNVLTLFMLFTRIPNKQVYLLFYFLFTLLQLVLYNCLNMY